jgi:two-component system, chemotaxis family, protein-glutamate methylesterase/glutaminase
MAVVLTGMGDDGKRGVVEVRKKGGLVIAESDKSAIIFGMPKEAWETGAVQKLLSLEEMVVTISEFLGERRT